MSEKAPRRAKRFKRWTKDIIIRELKDLGRRLGRSPKARDDKSLAQGARKLFGSWNKAKESAGLKIRPHRKVNETEFLCAFDRPMTIRQLADKLGWPYRQVLDYMGRLKREGGIHIAKMWLRLGNRGSVKFRSHALFDGLAAVQVYYLPDSQNHKTALADMLKKVIDKSPSKGERGALTYHLKRGLPPDVFEKVHQHYGRPKVERTPKEEL